MREVYELWSFCIHSLRRTAPALAVLVVPVAPVVPVVPVALVVLVVPAVPVALVALVVPRPWGPQNPALPRN